MCASLPMNTQGHFSVKFHCITAVIEKRCVFSNSATVGYILAHNSYYGLYSKNAHYYMVCAHNNILHKSNLYVLMHSNLIYWHIDNHGSSYLGMARWFNVPR